MKPTGKYFFMAAAILMLTSTILVSDVFPQWKDGSAPQNTETSGTPHIEFVKSSHDFGKSVQNQSLVHEFAFKNTGDAPLIIERVKAG